jgi:hypothetical protein
VGALLLLLAPALSAAPVTFYEVEAQEEGRVLAVDARFPQGTSGELTLSGGFLADLDGLEREQGGVWAEARPRLSAPCPAGGCHLRYRFRLGDAAGPRSRHHSDAFSMTGTYVAQPGAWLLRPEHPQPDARYRLRVTTTPPLRFESGIFPSPEGGYAGLVDDLDDAPYSAFGPFDEASVPLPKGEVAVAIAPGKTGVTRDQILAWIQASGRAVSVYFGRFPLPRALVLVLEGGRGSVGFGTTMGNGGGSIMMFVGEKAVPQDLKDDWVLTHEMSHLALPDLMPHHWFEEGVATYVEPIARAQAGDLPASTVWSGLQAGLPKGLPAAGDQGLDRTHTWGRTYWGGALFCFVADLQIREKTDNRRSLQDALRGTLEAGGNLSVHWEMDRFVRTADQATGVRVLEELYKLWATKPAPVDLDLLWRRLGVREAAGGVSLDDTAPLAAVRRSFTAPPDPGAQH